MASIHCIACGGRFELLSHLPYQGELACPDPQCRTVMDVYCEPIRGTQVRRLFPSLGDLDEVWPQLGEIEQASLREAALALGVGAYTASEVIAVRALEALLRRLYGSDEMLGGLERRVREDARLATLSGAVAYFRDARNRVAHPEKISDKADAVSTFEMTKRLVREIVAHHVA